MLYVFLIVAGLCSNYMIASEKEQQEKTIKKAYYDKIISEIKDPQERAKYDKGYVVVGEDVDDSFIIPYSDIHIPVSLGNGSFMSYPLDHPIHQEMKKLEMEKNNKACEISLTK